MTAKPRPIPLQSAAPDAGFLACRECGCDDFAVVCHGIPHKPYVVALVCAECGDEMMLGENSMPLPN